MKNPPALLAYLDYRAYLRDEFAWRKAAQPGFSVRSFAKLAGIPENSATLISKVILSRRGLNQSMLFKFSKALDLKGDELKYFELLVQFNQAKALEEKNHFFKELSKYRKPRATNLTSDQMAIYDKWYYQVLRAYFGIHNNHNNPATIGREIFPPLEAVKVEQAIKALMDSKLIRKKANGYTVAEPHIALAQGVRSKASKAHVREMVQLALEMLDKVPPESREYGSLTMYLSKACFESIRERMRSFREEVKVLLDQDLGEDRIYTLSMQLFPNSQLMEPERSSTENPGLSRVRRT